VPKSHQALLILRIAFWTGLLGVVTLSLLPIHHLPAQTSLVWDKAQHATGFIGLALMGLYAYPGRTFLLCAGLLVTGAGIELAQQASGWRQGDVLDLLADGLGILAGYGIWRATLLLRS
jgi:hypothetical protein